MAAAPQLPSPDVIVGCDATVKIAGPDGMTVAGFAKDIQIEEQAQQEPVQAIGFYKPRGFKAVNWSGTINAEFHVSARPEEGLVKFDISTAVAAAATYMFIFEKKSDGTRIGTALAHMSSRSFNLSTNQLSGQRISFVLRDWKTHEGFN